MYSFPSASHRRAPAARSTMIGSPPTARNARTGLFTPPTSTSAARRNISSERGLCILTSFGEFIVACGRTIKIFASAILQPTRSVFRVIGEHDVCPGPINTCQNLQRDSLFLDPAVRGSRLHHGIFAADIICPDGNAE